MQQGTCWSFYLSLLPYSHNSYEEMSNDTGSSPRCHGHRHTTSVTSVDMLENWFVFCDVSCHVCVCVLRHVLAMFLLEQIDDVLHFTLNKLLAPKWVPPFVATTSNPRATTKIVGQKVSSMFLPNPCAMAVAMINDAEVRGHCHHSMLRFFAKKLNRLLDSRIFETTPKQQFKFEQGLCRMDCCPILGCFSDEAVNLAERDVRRLDSAFPQDLHVMLSLPVSPWSSSSSCISA